MPSKLYVGNLAYVVSNDDLHELFSEVGQVQSAVVITDKFSAQSKGFGFVEMATAQEAADAIQRFDSTELKGRNLKVNEAKPRESSKPMLCSNRESWDFQLMIFSAWRPLSDGYLWSNAS
jgi:RNA recognition motif-containing protein